MPLIVFFLVVFMAVCPAGAGAAGSPAGSFDEAREYWTGSVLSATFRAGVCIRKDGTARGVLFLRHSTGQTDVYHVYGYKKGNFFELSHPSGHVGKITEQEDGRLKGTIRLRNKFKINVQGRSQLNVPLSEECAPLR